MMRVLPYQSQAAGTSVLSGVHTDHVKEHHGQKDTGPCSDLVFSPSRTWLLEP